MQEKIVSVLNEMAEYLSISQMKKLQEVIIRNFAENLAEHNLEEKRDYYLSQIIRQTEEMDRLVVEMIELSKLDSEEFALKKEEVSFYQYPFKRDCVRGRKALFQAVYR